MCMLILKVIIWLLGVRLKKKFAYCVLLSYCCSMALKHVSLSVEENASEEIGRYHVIHEFWFHSVLLAPSVVFVLLYSFVFLLGIG